MSENKAKLTDEALDQVVGGAKRYVSNSSAEYANVREDPGLDSDVSYRVYNGTAVYTTGNTYTCDGYTWYEITLEGGGGYGWIAGSLIGY